MKLFRHVDEFLFKQIDQMKNSSNYQKMIDPLSNLTDSGQRILNQASTMLILLLPIIGLCALYIGNSSLRSNLELKKSALKLISGHRTHKSEVGAISNTVLSPFNITSKGDFEAKIQKIASSKGISGAKVDVGDFSQNSSGTSLTKTTGILELNSFTTQNLQALLESLLVRERVKIGEINFKRNNSTQLLRGNIEIIHFGRKAQGED